VILLLDNYDSFVHNLARYVRRLGHETLVVRSDAIDARGARALRPGAIVLSPGPRTPAEAGCSIDVVRRLTGEIPILGVCLGHQAIGAAMGAKIVRAAEPMHGRTSLVYHDNASIFAGLTSPLRVCRYHSLVIDRATLGRELQPIAWTADEAIMAVAHREHPTIGVQFHPEAILTEHGYALLAAFLRLAKLSVSAPLPNDELDALADFRANDFTARAGDSDGGYADAGEWPLPVAAAPLAAPAIPRVPPEGRP
jgi:anthranilate synthase/aminodeoxychorismate synthase-like glutamine amidotransferase